MTFSLFRKGNHTFTQAADAVAQLRGFLEFQVPGLAAHFLFKFCHQFGCLFGRRRSFLRLSALSAAAPALFLGTGL